MNNNRELSNFVLWETGGLCSPKSSNPFTHLLLPTGGSPSLPGYSESVTFISILPEVSPSYLLDLAVIRASQLGPSRGPQTTLMYPGCDFVSCLSPDTAGEGTGAAHRAVESGVNLLLLCRPFIHLTPVCQQLLTILQVPASLYTETDSKTPNQPSLRRSFSSRYSHFKPRLKEKLGWQRGQAPTELHDGVKSTWLDSALWILWVRHL